MMPLFGLFKSKVSAVDRHFQIVEKLRSVKNEDTLISLCKEDIHLVDDFKREYVKKATEDAEKMNLKGEEKRKYVSLPPNYPSFKKLAILYEKRKMYDDAIAVCKLAIKSGYGNDGTDSGMKGRIEKLKKKKESNKNAALS